MAKKGCFRNSLSLLESPLLIVMLSLPFDDDIVAMISSK